MTNSRLRTGYGFGNVDAKTTLYCETHRRNLNALFLTGRNNKSLVL